MKKLFSSLLFSLLIALSVVRADEGMWIPMLLDRFNIDIMQREGFKLTAEDIYSINKASMKDAVMIFGGGCTAELISPDGLLITNHHCGYRSIQRHSTVEHDYLTNGFWAMARDEELPNPGLTVTFLVRMEDVSERILGKVNDEMSEEEREQIVREESRKIVGEAEKGTIYKAQVKPFYLGNQYFLIVQKVYRDVRLVGAPPSAIGKFGGDTDNWMWPRHTGDFSLFRIYAGTDNEPADYSEKNQPYHPAYYFPISLKGVHPDDFTMVFGYPGSTYEYAPSVHLEMLVKELYPRLIKIRDKKLEIINAAQEADQKVRIQYAAKNASISNSWKRWIGEIRGLDKLDAVAKKKAFEEKFQAWADADPQRKEKYGSLLEEYAKLYPEYGKYDLWSSCLSEVFVRYGVEAAGLARYFVSLENLSEQDAPQEEVDRQVEALKKRTETFFRDYDVAVDKQLFLALLKMYEENMPQALWPADMIKWKGKEEKFMKRFYAKTIFADADKMKAFLDGFSAASLKKLKKDPAYQLAAEVGDIYREKIYPRLQELELQKKRLDRLYMAGQLAYHRGEHLYPDANFTLRVTYGKVKGYEPRDAVYYLHLSTLRGVMEKDNPDIYDYHVPEKLKELYRNKDFGRYGEKGRMPVCFIATNHTTGGNSGSPVVNAEGHLIGVNFDRAWEGVMSDLMYNPAQCRNISLDIRYALFLIDKYAGAGWLLKEMKIIE